MSAVEEQIDRVERALASFIEQSEVYRRDHQESMRRHEEEMRRFQERSDKVDAMIAQSQARMEKERLDFNKRMAELSDSMGTLVEDMVAPNGDRIAQEIFGDDDTPLDTFQRIRRRRSGETMEIDLLIAGKKNVMIVESKRRIRPEDPARFLDRLKRFKEFFPEYASHRIIPVMASVSIDPSMISHLNRQKVYGVAFGEETMELINRNGFQL